jgi:hypothetical protein
MLAAEQTLPPSTQPAARSLRSGRVVACPIDEALLLVIGAGGSMSGELPAEINDDASVSWVASIIGWQLPSPAAPATHGFAALLPVDGTSRPLTTIRFGGEGGRRYVFAPRSVSLGDAVTTLAELAETQLAGTLDSLVDVMMQGPLGRR